MKKQYEIELSNEAEDDFDNSYEYYANVSEKVADNFYRQVDNSLTNISENPLRYPEFIKVSENMLWESSPLSSTTK